MILFANFTACNDEVVFRLDMVIKWLCIKRYGDEIKQFSYALPPSYKRLDYITGYILNNKSLPR